MSSSSAPMRWKRGSGSLLYRATNSPLDSGLLLHGADERGVVFEVGDKVAVGSFDALHILVVEVRLHEGLVVRGVADGRLVNG